MTAEAVGLDLAGAPGAVISSLVPLREGSTQRVLVLADLIRLEATVAGTVVTVQVANTSSEPLHWARPEGPASEVPAGEMFELTVGGSAGVGRLQVIAGGDVATTLTLFVCEGASGGHLLAQAIVGG